MNALDSDGATPTMAQWFTIKADHPNALIFLRMGDFFELFFDDAEAAAAALDITLTHRGEHGGKPIPMCGVPVAAAEQYLARLIRRGFRVAVAEQMEDPKAKRAARVPIRREVVRLVTPGTLTEDSLLEAGAPNLLLALASGAERIGAAWLDVSTGLFETESVAPGALPALLGRLHPAEILAPDDLPLGGFEAQRAPSPAPPPPLVARRRLAEAFEIASLDALGSFSDAEAMAAMRALDYVRATQAGAMPRLSRPSPLGEAGRMVIDEATRASLEIDRARDGGGRHTLLAAVRRTLTAAGARKLAAWLGAPLTDLADITRRQDAWGWVLAQPEAGTRLRTCLRGAPDIARALGRLSLGRGSPRDLAAIGAGLMASREAGQILRQGAPPALAGAAAALAFDGSLQALLAAALVHPAPARLDEGGCIAAGFDAELDAERGLRDDSRRVIAGMQLDLAQRFGVAALKIRHHAQLGYVIEAPANAVERLRAEPSLTLRQSMANGARFTTGELAELDRRICEAAARAEARERVVFAHLVKTTLDQAEALAAAAEALALLDVAQSAASLAEAGTWCRPDLTDGPEFRITAGRHPVVEAALPSRAGFVANDCDLSPERLVLLLTGPNMAGKSTFLRQNALMAVLAQAGFPVPAAAARIGLVDRLFSRVGGADDLARGRSTFMVEMTETAAILTQAGPRSLVVVDEIGRGTATLDGLAIAWAVLEALHSQLRSRTIFATHFHELARLSAELPCLSPHTMRVKEWKGEVIFLHEVAPGAGGRSWGVHVARLAGVPNKVVRRAAALLTALEKRGALTEDAELPLFARAVQDHAARPDDKSAAPIDELLQALRDINPDQLSPREALETLYRMKSLLPVQDRSEGVRSVGC
jgi:DNA mismatch repair protein MutS